MATADESEKTFQDAFYAVLLIDILNQSESLKRLASHSISTGKTPEYIEMMRNSAGRVIWLRQLMRSAFEGFAQAPLHPGVEQMSPDQRRQFDSIRECSITEQVFSDTVMGYSPLRNPSGNVSVRGVFALVATACSLMSPSME